MPTRPVEVPLSPYGKWAQGELYGTANRAMAGGGLMLPGDVARMARLLQSGIDREYESSRNWTQTHLDRTVAPEDATVRNYITDLGRANYASVRNSVPEQFELQKLADMGVGADMATNALSEERGVATQLAGMNTQGSISRGQIPSFTEGIWKGVGGGMGWAMGSSDQPRTDPAVTYGRIMSSQDSGTYSRGTGMPSGYSGSQMMWNNVNNYMRQ